MRKLERPFVRSTERSLHNREAPRAPRLQRGTFSADETFSRLRKKLFTRTFPHGFEFSPCSRRQGSKVSWSSWGSCCLSSSSQSGGATQDSWKQSISSRKVQILHRSLSQSAKDWIVKMELSSRPQPFRPVTALHDRRPLSLHRPRIRLRLRYQQAPRPSLFRHPPNPHHLPPLPEKRFSSMLGEALLVPKRKPKLASSESML